MIIDAHTHVVPSLRVPTRAERTAGWPYIVEDDGARTVMQGEKSLRRLTSPAWDVADRSTQMDRLGVATQVLLPAPFLFLYDRAPAVAAEFAEVQNEAIADFCAAAPERFVGFASVPLQDPERAVRTLRRAVKELGLRGVEIGTHAHSLLLHDAALDVFFAEAEALDVPVFVHPGPLDRPDRTAHNGLAFALARPVETELAVGSLVHGGVLERHPALRVCLAHGGGGIPALAGRMEIGWSRNTPGARAGSPSPRALLRRLYADTLTYDPYVLPLVERAFGPDHLVVGSDFPFATQESPPGAAVLAALREGLLSSLDGDDLARNAGTFLNGCRPPRIRRGASRSLAGTERSEGNE